MAKACNNHTSKYYCDVCSPPSEREKDEASNRIWYDKLNPPQKQVLTQEGPTDIPPQTSIVTVIEDDEHLYGK